VFAPERTEKVTVINKKRNFDHRKRRTLTVKQSFYFAISELEKKLFKFEKHKNKGF